MNALARTIHKWLFSNGLVLLLSLLAGASVQAQDRRIPPAARFSTGSSSKPSSTAANSTSPPTNRVPAWQGPQPRLAPSPTWQQTPREPSSSSYRLTPRVSSGSSATSSSSYRATTRVFPFAEDERSGVPESIPSPGVRTESLPQGQRSPVDGEIVYENGNFAADVGADEQVISVDGVYDDGVYQPYNAGPRDPMADEVWNVCSPCSFLNEFSIFCGPQSFKTPVDLGLVGNFGFHAGANVGDAIWHRFGLGYQLGGGVAFSDFNGANGAGAAPGVFPPGAGVRRQVFATGGLFHRAFYGYGWQGGIVVDYLDDNFFVTTSLSQLRTELSWVFRSGHEFGFHTASRTRQNDQTAVGFPVYFQPINMYNFYYRRNFNYGGNCRAWAGATGSRGAVIGGDAVLPLTNRVDLSMNFNYILPSPGGLAGAPNEAWATTMNLVWYPGRAFTGDHNGPYRPLFNVADNSSFIMERAP